MRQGSGRQREIQPDFQAPAKKNNGHWISKLRASSDVEDHGDPRGKAAPAASRRSELIATLNPVTAPAQRGVFAPATPRQRVKSRLQLNSKKTCVAQRGQRVSPSFFHSSLISPAAERGSGRARPTSLSSEGFVQFLALEQGVIWQHESPAQKARGDVTAPFPRPCPPEIH